MIHTTESQIDGQWNPSRVSLLAQRYQKLRAKLLAERPGLKVPAPSTIGDLLRREGLSEPRKRKRSASPSTEPLRHAAAPNDVWCIDFKGWFVTTDGTRCDPLTVTDAKTRKVLECHIVDPVTAAVQARMDTLFEVYGMPLAIRSDNGPPFASTGAAGLSRLAVHWLKLGIALERIQPGHPEQNGRHERMHATLRRETLDPASATPAEQQARFDAWRREFNADRPHEALGLTPPDAHYEPSPRPFTGQPQEPEYPDEAALRKVRSSGTIKWGGKEIYVSQSLTGETVAVIETDAGDWRVRFATVDLGLIDRQGKKLKPFPPPRSRRREQEQTPKSAIPRPHDQFGRIRFGHHWNPAWLRMRGLSVASPVHCLATTASSWSSASKWRFAIGSSTCVHRVSAGWSSGV